MKNTPCKWNVLLIGALLVCNFACISAHAQEADDNMIQPKSQWLDPYPKRMGLMWNVGADVVSNYIWRGLYVGGLGIQADFMVGYEGLFLDMWWNIGATDWTFKSRTLAHDIAFNPEVDMTIGFSRWGLTVLFMHMYYFDRIPDPILGSQRGDNSRFFDFANHEPGGGGITTEWRVKYKVSSKLPLSILVCTRTWGRDGYYDALTGELKRAYSTYIELGYDFKLPYELTLEARLGFTPAKSLYTGFRGDFAVNNASVKLIRAWDLSNHVYMTAFANMMLNPYDIATNAKGLGSVNGGRQILWNVGCGFYLK